MNDLEKFGRYTVLAYFTKETADGKYQIVTVSRGVPDRHIASVQENAYIQGATDERRELGRTLLQFAAVAHVLKSFSPAEEILKQYAELIAKLRGELKC